MTARIVRWLVAACASAAALSTATASAQVTVGAEVVRDRATYHFENPSTYDTTDLVPHSFEQHYVLDNVWLTASAAYRAGVDWHTSVGLTPVRQAAATDYDTFFDPGGVTWVSGTSGDARTHAVRVVQQVELGRAGPLRLSGGYRFRVDVADFLEGDKTDRRNGVLVSRTIVTTRETTNAQTHEVFLSASHDHELSAAWRLQLAVDVAPAAIDRLAITLPDKYPGQALVYRTTTLAASGRVTAVRTRGAWPIGVDIRTGRSWSYRSAQQARRSDVGVAVRVGRGW